MRFPATIAALALVTACGVAYPPLPSPLPIVQDNPYKRIYCSLPDPVEPCGHHTFKLIACPEPARCAFVYEQSSQWYWIGPVELVYDSSTYDDILLRLPY